MIKWLESPAHRRYLYRVIQAILAAVAIYTGANVDSVADIVAAVLCVGSAAAIEAAPRNTPRGGDNG